LIHSIDAALAAPYRAIDAPAPTPNDRRAAPSNGTSV
jgi:hypothetical protein